MVFVVQLSSLMVLNNQSQSCIRAEPSWTWGCRIRLEYITRELELEPSLIGIYVRIRPVNKLESSSLAQTQLGSRAETLIEHELKWSFVNL
jgi:hypothetical protein